VSRRKRTTDEYLQSAKRLAKFAPSLRKYKRRKTLTRYEKSAIARKEKILRYSDHLIPLTKNQAKDLKTQLFAPGVRAIQLRNTETHARIKRVRDDLIVTSNGRTWVYWKLEREDVKTKKGMKKAAEKAFEMQFPIEQIAELARKSFDELAPLAVYLWAPSGRVGEGFQTIKQFLNWLYDNWNAGRYTHQEKWVNGIAILLNEDGDNHDEEDDE
jgi:hypothetical protein